MDTKAERQVAQQTTGRGVFVPLAFQPGEAFQFDWSEDWAIVAGERTRLQVAHFKLSHSRAFILRAYPLQTHEMLFDAHLHAFRVLGGVPQRYHHHQSQLLGMGGNLRRRQNDHRSARPADAPLPHPGDRKRQLPLQGQRRQHQTRKGKIMT